MPGQSGKRYDKLLASSFEFRIGPLNYPAVAGKLVGGAVNDVRPWDSTVAGVVWPEQGSEEHLYFDLYRGLLMRGINVTTAKPILKVKTVEQALITTDNIGLAGHHFFRFGRFGEEDGTDGNEYLDRKVKAPARPVDENEKGQETYHPGGYGAQFAETLWNKLPADMTRDAPEFKLLGLYVEHWRNNPDLKLEDIYALHLLSGEEPIKALVSKGKEGYRSTNPSPKEYVWVGPDHPDYPDVADDSSTVKARSESEPEDMMKDSEYQSFVELQPHEAARMKYHEEKQQAAVGFDDADDETYFPAAGKATSAKGTPESADKVNKNPRRLGKVRGNSRAEQTTAMNLKVLTQFQQTVASSSGTSPVRAFTSLYNTPTNSPATAHSNIQLSSTNTPVIQHGVPNTDRAKSPLKQSTPSATQLRPESPAFMFDVKNRLADDKPAVSSLLRMIQKEGVMAATTSQKSNAEVRGDPGSQVQQSPLSEVASPSPINHQPAVEQRQNFGTASGIIPGYYTLGTQSRPQSQPAGTAMTSSMASGQPHSQTQVNSGTSSPLYQPSKSLSSQTATASQTQNIATHINQRPRRVHVSRHNRQQHPSLQSPRSTLPGPSRFPQPQPHQPANTNYYQSPPAGPASMSSTHVSAAHTQGQHASTPNATVFSYPQLAHPQPKVSANVASAFSSYQSKMDGQSQGGGKECAGDAASGQQNPFQFTFGS